MPTQFKYRYPPNFGSNTFDFTLTAEIRNRVTSRLEMTSYHVGDIFLEMITYDEKGSVVGNATMYISPNNTRMDDLDNLIAALMLARESFARALENG